MCVCSLLTIALFSVGLTFTETHPEGACAGTGCGGLLLNLSSLLDREERHSEWHEDKEPEEEGRRGMGCALH